jgi:probable HAF family extracellular repeat protein
LGGAESAASDINEAGQIVGHSLLSSGLHHAFIWTPGATDGTSSNPQMKDLGTLLGTGGESYAYAINSSGQIAGWAQVPEGFHAFIYSASKITDIGNLLNSLPYSYAYGINDAGHVAGTAYDANYSTPTAFFYDGKSMKDLGNLGGGAGSALALNGADQVVGYSSTKDSVDHAFLFAAGKMTDLGTLGGHYSYANAINNQNVIVGGSFTDAADSVYHAFISSNGVMTDLNNQLDSSGQGWTLSEAKAINDSGQIVGLGTIHSATHMFLLTPGFRLASIEVFGRSVLLRFPTEKGATYSVQTRANLGSTSWSGTTSGIAGTGNMLTVTNAIGASGTQFYRVLQN